MLLPVLYLVLALLGALLLPLYGVHPQVTVALVCIVLAMALLTVTRLSGFVRWDALNARFLRSPRWKGLLSSLLAILLLFGALEFCARALTTVGLLNYYRPIVTVQSGVDSSDWRAYHITRDMYREADPILFWRPARRYPYNAQGFKGPELPPVKGPHEFRIFCYGDSNTDGPERGGWPEQLQALLDRKSVPGVREFRVVNAGVAGYSSYQGLCRFRQEVSEYSPDIVLVSFGWNDHCRALGAPDNRFRSEAPMINALQGVLFRYRFYLVMKQYAGRYLLRSAPYAGPRVALGDYLANMAGFLETAHRHGAAVVLLTRPHAAARDQVLPDYLPAVVRCNKELLGFAGRERARAVDIAGAFGSMPSSLFADSCHFSPEGHREMAELLCSYLEENGLIPVIGAPR
jgi:lysophospholipase L1-like esterase